MFFQSASRTIELYLNRSLMTTCPAKLLTKKLLGMILIQELLSSCCQPRCPAFVTCTRAIAKRRERCASLEVATTRVVVV